MDFVPPSKNVMAPTKETHAAVFLDRDGVLNHNRADYVKSVAELQLYPNIYQTLAQLARTPYKIFIVTNQSGVGRGIFSLATAHAINQATIAAITAHNGRIDAAYLCPHHPDDCLLYTSDAADE